MDIWAVSTLGLNKQSSHVQVFLRTFLLGTNPHADLPAQRVRHTCDFGRNGHMAFREAAPSAPPQQLPQSAKGAMTRAVFFSNSARAEWCISSCIRQSRSMVLEEMQVAPGPESFRWFLITGISILAHGLWEKDTSAPTTAQKCLVR